MPVDDLVYDVGMCDGSDTAYYLSEKFRVIAIEANPALVSRALVRFARAIAKGKLVIIGKAIGAAPGTVRFGIHSTNDEWGSTEPERLKHFGKSIARTVEVECTTLDAVTGEHGTPHYVKIDIEGSDLAAVEAIGRMPDRPTYVSAEAISGEIIERLRDYGYQRFMLVDQAAKNHLRQKWFLRRKFTDRHSGPFGERAPGTWASFDQTISTYRDMVAAGKLTWHDFHAAL
jgi:FkbM family methyltransferase